MTSAPAGLTAGLIILAVVGFGIYDPSKAAVPWAVWSDLHLLARLLPGDQVLLRSSHCPSGCRFDRHSDGDWRYVYLDGGEGVIFEEAGAGAITRIWMTMGQGASVPLASSVTLRIYVDGAAEPVFEAPLPDLFNGSTPPFVPPLAGERLVSSGGNFSYVPIAYRDGCRVTLAGAHQERIWFQFSFHRLAEPGDVVSWNGRDAPSTWAALLGAAGEDPWPLSGALPGTWAAGEVLLEPGETVELARLAGPDSLTALRFRLPESAWPDVDLGLTFDGEERVRLPLADFFAVGRGGSTDATRSLLLGAAEDGSLYCYFPMPFFESAQVSLTRRGGTGGVSVAYEVRRANAEPAPDSGLFGAFLHADDRTPAGSDIPLLELEGRGKWVGLFAELSSVETLSRSYLEGDERLYLDRSPHPALYGTGTEDLFNGGFYFDQGPVRLALHGAPYHFVENGEDVTAAYRLMLTDGVRFVHGIRAGLEGGPTNDLSLRVRTVAYYYQRPKPELWRSDVLDLGDPSSLTAHGYTVSDSAYELATLDALFQSEPPRSWRATGVYRPPGEARFRLRTDPGARRLRLRRRFDAGQSGQAAEIRVGGHLVGHFPPVDENPFRRWREIDVDLPSAAVTASGEVEVAVVALPHPGSPAGESPEPDLFTAFTYELWSDVDPTIFSDGFESGDLAAWR